MQWQHRSCACSLTFHSFAFVYLRNYQSTHVSFDSFYHRMHVIKDIKRVSIADHIIAVPIYSIKEKCMRINIDGTHVFVCYIFNS